MEAKINIFFLDDNPLEAARLQCDKHVVKMIVESAQMLSTAHRMLDGQETKRPSKSGKRMSKYWVLDDDREDVLYKAVHMHHPSTKWTMENEQNYTWHQIHFQALCSEYTYRYDKVHSTETKLGDMLTRLPTNIPSGSLTPIPLAMKSNPECMFEDDPVKSYRLFYQTKQERFKMAWTKRDVPLWFNEKETET